MNVAVVSPHFDDAVLSCWTVLTGSDDVDVVTVYTAGPPAGVVTEWDAESGVDSATRMRRRADENRRALALAGRRAVDLGCLEAQYDGGEIDLEALARHLRAADVVYAPAGTGAENLSLEHVLVRDACLVLRPDCRLYADQPYSLFRPDTRLLPEAPVPDLLQRVVSLSAEERREKAEAVACYAGEVANLERIYGPVTDPDRLGYEVFWVGRA